MLDHQHRAGLRHLADYARYIADILLPHAGHRLVEQQHFRVEGKRRGNLQHTLAAIGKVSGEGVAFAFQADRLDQLVGPGVQPVERRQGQPELGRQSVRTLQCDSHIVEHGKMREYGRNLEGPHEAHPRHLVRRGLRDVCTEQGYRTFRRLEELGEQVEDRCLACAVRSDQGMDARVMNIEIDVLHRSESAEMLGEAAGGKHDPRLFMDGCSGERHYFTRSQPLLAGSM